MAGPNLNAALSVPWALSLPSGPVGSPGDGTPFLEVKCADSINITSSVRSVTVEDNDRLIDKATILLEDPEGTTANVPREGQKIRVDLGWPGEHQVIFEGLVTSVPARAARAGVNSLTIVAHDPSWRMIQVREPRTLGPGKLSSILEAMIGTHGIPKGIILCEPDPEFSVERPLRQGHESDWHFIQRMALEYSARAYVEYSDNQSKFYFQPESTLLRGDAQGTLHYCRGFRQLIQFNYNRTASGASAQTSGTSVDPGAGSVVPAVQGAPSAPGEPVTPNPDLAARVGLRNPNTATRDETAVTVANASPSQPADQLPVVPSVGNPSDPTLPERLSQRDPTRLLGYAGEGVAVGTNKLRAKGKITITGIASWAEGDWYVRKAVHVFTRSTSQVTDARTGRIVPRSTSSYETRFTVTR